MNAPAANGIFNASSICVSADQAVREAGVLRGAHEAGARYLRQLHHEGAALAFARKFHALSDARLVAAGRRAIYFRIVYLCEPPISICLTFVSTCAAQDYSKECLQHVQKHLMKNDVPVQLFEVIRMRARTHSAMFSNCVLMLPAVHRGDLQPAAR